MEHFPEYEIVEPNSFQNKLKKSAAELLRSTGFPTATPPTEELHDTRNFLRNQEVTNAEKLDKRYAVAVSTDGKWTILGVACWGTNPSLVNGFGQQGRWELVKEELDKANLMQLAVDPRFRGQGVARALIQFVTEQATECGYTILYGQIDNDFGNNLQLESLYSSTGFTLAEEGVMPPEILDLPPDIPTKNARQGKMLWKNLTSSTGKASVPNDTSLPENELDMLPEDGVSTPDNKINTQSKEVPTARGWRAFWNRIKQNFS